MRCHITPSLVLMTCLAANAAAQPGQGGGPPQEAVDACSGAAESEACSFESPHGQVSGTCRTVPEGDFACVPAGHGQNGGHQRGGDRPPRGG